MLVISVYWQVRHFEFVSFDDGLYVFSNERIRAGFSGDWLAWSFGFEGKDKTYWHPLTWISHMLDVELFGLDPGAHHLTNVAIHFVNTCLVFLVLVRMTGSPWRSFLVGALFAVHPVNVESVAWVAERKNVLSTAFWLLTTYLYVLYVERPDMKRYAALLFAFTLGLLTKPMLVTMPCTLLLLDFWPLKRLNFWFQNEKDPAPVAQGPMTPARKSPWEVIGEKIPLFLLSFLVSYLAYGSVKAEKLDITYESLPMALRVKNALVSYLDYIGKLLWPSDLSMFYPFPESIPTWEAGVALSVLSVLSAGAILAAKKRPYIMVGWFWFLGTLVPVSGIVQAGLWPALADRWAYIPYIGLFVIVIWGMGDVLKRIQIVTLPVAFAAAVLAVGALAYAGHRQTAVWQDGITLYRDALEKNSDNFVAHNNLGVALCQMQHAEEALPHFTEAARINPAFPMPYFNIGHYFLQKDLLNEAEEYFNKAISLYDDYAGAHMFLGQTLLRQGKLERALFHYKAAQRSFPYEKKIYNDTGVLYLKSGQLDDAVHVLKAALRIDPNFAEAHNNIGLAYYRKGEVGSAIDHFKKSLALAPDNVLAKENLAEAISSIRSN
jgi:tetratricopeptide (TPR) repeat protein